MANNEGLCRCGHIRAEHQSELLPDFSCTGLPDEGCGCTGYRPAETADALEDAADAYLHKYFWNVRPQPTMIETMEAFARQEIQRREQEIAAELKKIGVGDYRFNRWRHLAEYIEKLTRSA